MKPKQADEIKKAIRDQALDVGFDAVGFASAEAVRDDGERLLEYLKQGRQGDMAWMAETFDRRKSPRDLWPEARSVIAFGLNYGPAEDPLAQLDHKDRGAISVYARGRDYHDLLKKRLKRVGRWMAETYGCPLKVFVDTAPVMEKPLAVRAGLGWRGKHTNLVSRDFGSWLFLGEIFTPLSIPPDDPVSDLCGSCEACLKACPTGALTEPGRIDARLCISYLTIEHKGPIPETLREPMGNRIYGCDDCLAVCPWNKFATPHEEKAFTPRESCSALKLADLAALDDAAFRKAFSGSPLKRTGRDAMVRNALIAIGNSGDGALVPIARRLCGDSSPLVRDASAWALGKLAVPGNE